MGMEQNSSSPRKWDFEIQTGHPIPFNLGLIYKKKITCHIVDFCRSLKRKNRDRPDHSTLKVYLSTSSQTSVKNHKSKVA